MPYLLGTRGFARGAGAVVASWLTKAPRVFIDFGNMPSAKSVIAEYLRQTKWSQRKLALMAGISPAVLSRLNGKGERTTLGELAALKLERATMEAFRRNETHIPPLRAMDLHPSKAA